MMDGRVTISELEKVYGEGAERTKAIENLSFEVEGGEFVSVVDDLSRPIDRIDGLDILEFG